MVKVTVTDRKCNAACQNGFSNKCACSCGGRFHGLANRIPQRDEPKAAS